VCSESYYLRNGVCEPCGRSGMSSFVALIAVLPISIIIVIVGSYFYASSFNKDALDTINDVAEDAVETTQNVVASLWKFFKAVNLDGIQTKVKILISLCQIISSFPTVLNFAFPIATEKVFRVFNFVNIGGFRVTSVDCVTSNKIDYIGMRRALYFKYFAIFSRYV
jgi:hypothetical protein